MKKKILIVGSDPNSINSEIIYKSWKSLKLSERNRIYVISNHKLLMEQFKVLKYPIKLTKVNNLYDNVKTNGLKVINIDVKFKDPFKVPTNSSSLFIRKSFAEAHKVALSGEVVGIINCPLNKKLLKTNLGVTEYLASKCKIKDNSEVMLIKQKFCCSSNNNTHQFKKCCKKN